MNSEGVSSRERIAMSYYNLCASTRLYFESVVTGLAGNETEEECVVFKSVRHMI
jgi:hypothetical protein